MLRKRPWGCGEVWLCATVWSPLLAQPHSADLRPAPLGRLWPSPALLQREVSIYSDPLLS